MLSHPVVMFCSPGGSVCPRLQAVLWWCGAGQAAPGCSWAGAALLQKVLLQTSAVFFVVFVTGIFICCDHSWPDICHSLVGSLCWIINAGVMYEDDLLQHGDHIWGGSNMGRVLVGP